MSKIIIKFSLSLVSLVQIAIFIIIKLKFIFDSYSQEISILNIFLLGIGIILTFKERIEGPSLILIPTIIHFLILLSAGISHGFGSNNFSIEGLYSFYWSIITIFIAILTIFIFRSNIKKENPID